MITSDVYYRSYEKMAVKPSAYGGGGTKTVG